MPSLAHYMAQYDHEHESGWNKFLHGVGIPMIFAGLHPFHFDEVDLGQQVFLSADGFFFFSDTALKETIPRFSKDRFICWLDQSGSPRKHGCFLREHTAGRPRKALRKVQ